MGQGFPKKTVKKAAKVVPVLCRGEQGETDWFSAIARSTFGTCRAQPGRVKKKIFIIKHGLFYCKYLTPPVAAIISL
jgi:hypothetical protein